MYHLRPPVLLLMSLVLLRCVATAPSNSRYFSSSANGQESASPDQEGWMVPGLAPNPFLQNPFLSLVVARPQRQLKAFNSHNIGLEKRRCNTVTCATQRLAEFLVRSSNTVGTVYAPTNVGSGTYGKRDLLQLANY